MTSLRPRRSQKKAVLAIQGGGAQAAFAAGAWRVLARWLREHEIGLAGVGGASAGAWNAALIARHWHEQDHGSSALERFWQDIAVPSAIFLPPASELFRSWNGFLSGFLLGNRNLFLPNVLVAHAGTMPALYNHSPMLATFARLIGDCSRASGAPVLVVKAVDAQTGMPVAFDNRRSPITSVHLKASASIPLLFPATRVGDRLYWDGDFARRSVLDDVIEAARDDVAPGTALLGILIEPFPHHADVPATTLGMSFALLAGLLSGKGEDDSYLHQSRKAHADFVRRAHELVGDNADPELSRLVNDEHRRLSQQERNTSILRITRTAGPYDHISRDFDYSPERIAALIRQGEAAAEKALAAPAPTRHVSYA